MCKPCGRQVPKLHSNLMALLLLLLLPAAACSVGSNICTHSICFEVKCDHDWMRAWDNFFSAAAVLQINSSNQSLFQCFSARDGDPSVFMLNEPLRFSSAPEPQGHRLGLTCEQVCASMGHSSNSPASCTPAQTLTPTKPSPNPYSLTHGLKPPPC